MLIVGRLIATHWPTEKWKIKITVDVRSKYQAIAKNIRKENMKLSSLIDKGQF